MVRGAGAGAACAGAPRVTEKRAEGHRALVSCGSPRRPVLAGKRGVSHSRTGVAGLRLGERDDLRPDDEPTWASALSIGAIQKPTGPIVGRIKDQLDSQNIRGASGPMVRSL
jgi:hypothetical protein